MSTKPPVLDEIPASLDWISKALSGSGYLADFSPASLWHVERFFEDQMLGPDRPKPRGILGKDPFHRVVGIGMYVGEVLRGGLGGEWICEDDDDPNAYQHLILKLPGDVICWPVERAMKRFVNGPEDGIPFYAISLGLDIGPKPDLKRPWWKVW